MSYVVEAPDKTLHGAKNGWANVFLAGTIEMGKSFDWQKVVIDKLQDKKVNIFNPRRSTWDSSWVQDINNPQFFEQVKWELTRMELSDYILMYFDPSSKSPISLLELGLYADTRKLMVTCPEGFWRRGNVQIVCQHYNVPLFDSVESMIVQLEFELDE